MRDDDNPTLDWLAKQLLDVKKQLQQTEDQLASDEPFVPPAPSAKQNNEK